MLCNRPDFDLQGLHCFIFKVCVLRSLLDEIKMSRRRLAGRIIRKGGVDEDLDDLFHHRSSDVTAVLCPEGGVTEARHHLTRWKIIDIREFSTDLANRGPQGRFAEL